MGPDESIDIYIRSLVVEAIDMDSRDITIRRDGGKLQISMDVHGQPVVFPHPPVKEKRDLIERLRERAGIPPQQAAVTQAKFSVLRRGSEVPIAMSYWNEGGRETVHLRLN